MAFCTSSSIANFGNHTITHQLSPSVSIHCPTFTPFRDAYKSPAASISAISGIDAIQDETAKQMFSRIQYTLIQTQICPDPINTSHIISSGNSNRPLLLFLHAFDSNILEFRKILSTFDETSYDCHFVDIFGWGFTERPIQPGIAYGPESKRSHLEAYIHKYRNQNNNGSVIAIGASIGGASAIDLLLKSNVKSYIQALILIDAQAFIDKKRVALLNIPGVARLGSLLLRSTWLRKKAAEISYYSDELKYDDDVMLIGQLHCFSPNWLEATIDFVRGEGYCLSNRVKDIDVPTLVLWGQYDRVLPKGDAQRFQDTIRNCRLEYIEDAGHSPHVEKPVPVTNAILDFLDQLSSTDQKGST